MATKGVKLTEEHKRKIGDALRGKKKNYPTWNKGKEWSNEIKEKIRISSGHKQSEETRKKMSESKMGEKHWNWQGGITHLPYSVDWTKTLKRSISERDNYICQVCNQYGSIIHHISYKKEDCNPINLITLCNSCHTKTNYNRSYWIEYFNKYLNN